VVADLQDRGRLIAFADEGALKELLATTLGGIRDVRLEQVRSVILDKYYQ
jgi:hypothetical protein